MIRLDPQSSNHPVLWQGWIRQAVRSEVADGSVALESLLEGTAASFVHVHSAAMLALVSAPAPVRPDACPETLLFDVHRLALLQREFQYEVTTAALLLTATNGVAATKKAADMQASARHLQHLSCWLCRLAYLHHVPTHGRCSLRWWSCLRLRARWRWMWSRYMPRLRHFCLSLPVLTPLSAAAVALSIS